MQHSLVPAAAQDRDVLLAIHASTREAELALTDWSTEQRSLFLQQQFEAQTRHYRSHYPNSQCLLIVVDGRAVGRFWVDRGDGDWHVLDIAIRPAARGLGLGTRCLGDWMAQAAAAGQPVSIYVEAHNPARRLYERLGFRPEGEFQGIHQRMVWRAASVFPSFPLASEECVS